MGEGPGGTFGDTIAVHAYPRRGFAFGRKSNARECALRGVPVPPAPAGGRPPPGRIAGPHLVNGPTSGEWAYFW